ncbi:MAG: PDZ domain-containing protein [Acidobacteriota bacterium]|nr:PDZ domain-containing protein [Acidobacteriota bacterium]
MAPVDLTGELCRHFGVEASGAVMIGRVEEDSPAAKAGVEVGDILLAVDGRPVESGLQLKTRVLGKQVGESLRLEVWRDGRTVELEAEVGQRPRSGLAVKWIGPMRRAREAVRQAREEWAADLDDGGWLRELKELERAREKELRERIDQLEEKLRQLTERLDRNSR